MRKFLLGFLLLVLIPLHSFARYRTIVLEFEPSEGKKYTYEAEIGGVNIEDLPFLIEGDRLYVQYDGPKFFIERKVDKDGKAVGKKVDNKELYKKFIYIGKVESVEGKSGHYKYIDDPNTPSIHLLTKTEEDGVIHTESESMKVDGITFFDDNKSDKKDKMHIPKKLKLLKEYEKEHYDKNSKEIKAKKLQEQIKLKKSELDSMNQKIEEAKEALKKLNEELEKCQKSD